MINDLCTNQLFYHVNTGSFTGPRQQEIVVARGNRLELLRPDSSGKMQTISSIHAFGVIRDLLPFRLTGGSVDYCMVGSDSGRIVVLKWDTKEGTWDKVHQETFGKTGCRRIVPGQFLAADPNGRAVCIGAIEKQKLVYVMNRDASARLTISSALEAHKSQCLVFDIVGVDVGFDNPVFACIELDYEHLDAGLSLDEAEKVLTYYEVCNFDNVHGHNPSERLKHAS